MHPAAIVVLALVVLYIVAQLIKSPKKDDEESDPSSLPPGGTDLYALANELNPFFYSAAHPRDLLEDAVFKRGVKMLRRSEYSIDDLLKYGTGNNEIIAVLAMEALGDKEEANSDCLDQLMSCMPLMYVWPLYFALQSIDRITHDPVIGRVLVHAPYWWADNLLVIQFLDEFIKHRLSSGERPGFGDALKNLDQDQAPNIRQVIKALDAASIKPLLDEFEAYEALLLDREFLNGIGKVLDSTSEETDIIKHPGLDTAVNLINESLFKDPVQSALLVGEPGTGKTTILKWYSRELSDMGWSVFEAGATEIIAGQIYIGQLEGRIKELVQNLDAKKKVIWFIPEIHELYHSGRSKYSPTGILNMLIPFIEKGIIRVVGETTPAGFQNMVSQNVRIQNIFKAFKVDALEDDATLDLAKNWVEDNKSIEMATKTTLQEAYQLCKQYMADTHAPGNLLGFLKQAQRNLEIQDGAKVKISIDDLLVVLSAITGLPLSILDERKGLNLDELRSLFNRRVLGQNEAVECLVERLAMIKSGLTDPDRPLGVFLFAGPTGTGKTEIAKTLTEFLFGSPDRMIRLDMSEFKTPESLDRILGTDSEGLTASGLTAAIRKQPFSVILLDEFEKSHMNVWDVFLQVFDDGRLTDPSGRTADFRHSIIILTSNLGSMIQTGEGLGFTPQETSFSLSGVTQAISSTFRPEFINRLDRVIVFRPLSRAVMRDILFQELDKVTQRRGLRSRNWAIEWEQSAIEFLLDKGFTVDLGARPLKRAIDQYLLSPLALTMVNHQLPEGDQFLFVRSSKDAIKVEFIDPDAVDEGDDSSESDIEVPKDFNLHQIILEPHGLAEELKTLSSLYEKLAADMTETNWNNEKEQLLLKVSQQGFWDSADRFILLGEIEFMDRLEAGMSTAGSLLSRLDKSAQQNRKFYSKKLLARLAQQLYLLKNAYRNYVEKMPHDAFLKVESIKSDNASSEFAQRLKDMYLSWARRRRMHFQILDSKTSNNEKKYESIIAFSGFGAYPILIPESGLHIYEEPGQGRSFQRCTARVHVLPQPVLEGALSDQAIKLYAKSQETVTDIVRRYREKPSPLVRDTVRKWRTGRIDLIWDGNFDIMH